jgi:uncharacterized protein YqeY
MSPLHEKMTNDMKDAMRARDADRLSAIRYLLSAIKYAQIDATHELDDEEIQAVLRKQAKLRRDAIDQYRKAGREDLATKEEAELAITEAYLPAALAPEQIREIVRAVIAETGASGPQGMGMVMKSTLARLGDQADGRVVQGIVREELAARGG